MSLLELRRRQRRKTQPTPAADERRIAVRYLLEAGADAGPDRQRHWEAAALALSCGLHVLHDDARRAE